MGFREELLLIDWKGVFLLLLLAGIEESSVAKVGEDGSGREEW